MMDNSHTIGSGHVGRNGTSGRARKHGRLRATTGDRCAYCYTYKSAVPERKFFRFPRDIALSKKWVLACERPDLFSKTVEQLYKNYRLCSEHFVPADYATSKMCRLKPTAYPKFYSETSEHTDCTLSSLSVSVLSDAAKFRNIDEATGVPDFKLPPSIPKRKKLAGIDCKTRWRTIRDSYKKSRRKAFLTCTSEVSCRSKYLKSLDLKFLDDVESRKRKPKSSIKKRKSKNAPELLDEDDEFIEVVQQNSNPGNFMYSASDMVHFANQGLVEVKNIFSQVKEVKVDSNLDTSADTGLELIEVNCEECIIDDEIEVLPSEIMSSDVKNEVNTIIVPQNSNPASLMYSEADMVHCPNQGLVELQKNVYSQMKQVKVDFNPDTFKSLPVQSKKHKKESKNRESKNKVSKEEVAEHCTDDISNDPLHTFFKSMAQVVARFPPHLIAETRLKVCSIVSEMEMRALSERCSTSSS